jgi:ferredoxin
LHFHKNNVFFQNRYLCGPAGFQQSVYDIFLQLGVRDERVHAESFGPSALKRAKVARTPKNNADEEALLVHFARSNKTSRWTEGTLLELAEEAGIDAAFSCRGGICGTCAVKCVAGKVEYIQEPIATVDVEDVLICCSRPKPGAHVQNGTGRDREGVTLEL